MEKTKEKHWLVVQRVERVGTQEQTVDEFLDFHPDDLEYVKETAEEQRESISLLEYVRLDFSHNAVEIRHPHLYNSMSKYAFLYSLHS